VKCESSRRKENGRRLFCVFCWPAGVGHEEPLEQNNLLVFRMACLGTGRMCVGVEKLTKFGIRAVVQRKIAPVNNNFLDVNLAALHTAQVSLLTSFLDIFGNVMP